MTLDGETVRNMLGLLQGARIDDEAYVTDVSLAEDETGLDITLVIGPEPREGVPVEEIKRETLSLGIATRPAGPRGPSHHRPTSDPPRALARQHVVPGFGWDRFTPASSRPPGAPGGHPTYRSPDVTLTNGTIC